MSQYAKMLYRHIAELNLDRNDEQIAQIRARIEAGKMSEMQAKAWLRALEPVIQDAMVCPNVLPAPPDEDTLYGDGYPEVELGTTENGLRFGIRPLHETKHMLVSGATGTGKSAFLRRLVIGLRKLRGRFSADIVVVIWDPKKDFVDVRLICEGPWSVLDAASTLRWGNQRPRNVPIDSWVNVLCTSFAAHTKIISARITITRVVRTLVKLLNLSDSSVELWPTWENVLHALESRKWDVFSAKGEYTQSAKQALRDAVLHSGTLLACARGFSPNEAVSKGMNVVIAVDQLTLPWLCAWLAEMIASYIFFGRLATGHKADRTEIVFVVDEADELVSARQDEIYPLGMSPFGRFLKQGRELGISCVLSVSVLKNVSPFVLANCSDLVMFNQADTASIVAARNALMLPPGDGDRFIAALKRRECIVRQGLSSVPFPFRVDVDHIDPYRGRPPQYDSHQYIPATPLSELPYVLTALDQLGTKQGETSLQGSTANRSFLSKNAHNLLKAAPMYRDMPVARLWDRIGKPSPKIQAKARQELENRHLAAFKEVRIERKNCLLMRIDDKGYELLGQKPLLQEGGGGIGHSQFSRWIRDVGKAREYARSECEWTVTDTNHRCDAAWLVDGRWHVFEVVVDCAKNLIDRCVSCLIDSDVVESVTVVAATKSQLAELKKRIQGANELKTVLDRIRFESIKVFMDELEDTWR